MEIIVDASPVGLGGIHEQGGKGIAYASRALTSTESRSSQTQREALELSGLVNTLTYMLMKITTSPSLPIINLWKRSGRNQSPPPPLPANRAAKA